MFASSPKSSFVSRGARWVLVGALVASVAGCRGCDDKSSQVDPALLVSPNSLSFGTVKVGESLALPVKLTAESRASVTLNALRIVDLEPAGAAAAFTILQAPETVPSLGSESFRILFTPTEFQLYAAQLIIASDDPERPEIKVTLAGEGATPQLVVTPLCETARSCQGSATVSPPALDFGQEPIQRLSPIPVTRLPNVALVNEGKVTLGITALAIEGADASAFVMQGNLALDGMLPDGTPALLLDPGEGVNVPIRFTPTAIGQASYSAELVVKSDDRNKPEVRIPLTGTLRDNLPPVICANVVTVVNGDGSPPASFNAPGDWSPLIPPPMSGLYDFTGTRDIQPSSRQSAANPGAGRTEVRLSAHSNATDVSTCTFDPEDGRAQLSYLWEILAQPEGAAPTEFGAGTQDDASPRLFLSQASGQYRLRLTVTDSLGASTSVELIFDAVLKQDLVVQLSWNGSNKAFAQVDLDLHLVRPSSDDGTAFGGVFSFFDEAPTGQTSGDLNGVARLAEPLVNGRNFNWGQSGTEDDPRLNIDDQGSGDLVENVSLNYPERDPECAGSRCTYKILVHYFSDGRALTGQPACNVSGCADGEQCNCAAGRRCVTNDGSASGEGTCYPPPQFMVRIFVRGDPTPLREIPLTGPDLAIGAVCQMRYVADISWPSQAEIAAGQTSGDLPLPDVTERSELAAFGARDGLLCKANSAGWFEAQ